MKNSLMSIVIIVALIFIALGSTLFTVYETDRAIIARLGDLKKDKETHQARVYGPGLHMKFPLIDSVYVFDARLNMTEIPSERIVTKEKEVLLVDLFVQWRIGDFALFYNATQGAGEGFGGKDRAEQLLRQNVKGVLNAEFGQLVLQEIISGERNQLMEKLVKRTDEIVTAYGMKVVDLRINRVEYPPEVNDKVFARMASERKQVAVGFRARGESRAAGMRAEADRTASVMIAEAEKEAERLKGEGDARAVEIYAESYNKSPEFYEFYRSLEAYRKSFLNKQDILMLKSDSDFFKYFRNGTVRGNSNGTNK